MGAVVAAAVAVAAGMAEVAEVAEVAAGVPLGIAGVPLEIAGVPVGIAGVPVPACATVEVMEGTTVGVAEPETAPVPPEDAVFTEAVGASPGAGSGAGVELHAEPKIATATATATTRPKGRRREQARVDMRGGSVRPFAGKRQPSFVGSLWYPFRR